MDHSYGYDLTGNLVSAGDSNGRTLTFGYDALGRRVSNGDNWYGYGNAWMQYDAAGRRTRYTWNDGFYVSPLVRGRPGRPLRVICRALSNGWSDACMDMMPTPITGHGWLNPKSPPATHGNGVFPSPVPSSPGNGNTLLDLRVFDP